MPRFISSEKNNIFLLFSLSNVHPLQPPHLLDCCKACDAGVVAQLVQPLLPPPPDLSHLPDCCKACDAGVVAQLVQPLLLPPPDISHLPDCCKACDAGVVAQLVHPLLLAPSLPSPLLLPCLLKISLDNYRLKGGHHMRRALQGVANLTYLLYNFAYDKTIADPTITTAYTVDG